MIEGSESERPDEPREEGASSRPDTQAPGGSSDPLSDSSSSSADCFAFNRPTIISLLYLSSFAFGVTAIVGIVLAYVWKNEAAAGWEASHYQYLINTFWIGLIGALVGLILTIVLIGLLVLPAVAVLVVVRCVLSLINAQKKRPMPNPGTLLA